MAGSIKKEVFTLGNEDHCQKYTRGKHSLHLTIIYLLRVCITVRSIDRIRFEMKMWIRKLSNSIWSAFAENLLEQGRLVFVSIKEGRL